MDDNTSYIPVEVYLPSTVFRGNLLMKQKRLSDFLNSNVSNGMIRLDNVEIQTLERKSPPVKAKNALINKRQVNFVVDISSGPSMTHKNEELFLVNKEPRSVLIELGLFWVQGDVHIVPGFELSTFAEGKSSFIPLTKARFVEFPESEPRTFIINRERVNCVMPSTEVLLNAAYPAAPKQDHARNPDLSRSFEHPPLPYEDM